MLVEQFGDDAESKSVTFFPAKVTDNKLPRQKDLASAGKMEAEHPSRALGGLNVRLAPVTGNKELRAKPVSAQA
jgi:phage terminase large subunit-like protein